MINNNKRNNNGKKKIIGMKSQGTTTFFRQ
jgi:hypothetical protein